MLSTQTHRTMLSTEIAEITGKRHDHVMRDIINTIAQLVTSPDLGGSSLEARESVGSEISKSFQPSTYKDSYGREQKCYALDYEATLVMLTGYDVVARAKVIRRWQELEEQSAKPKALSSEKLEQNLIFAKHMCEMLNLPDSGRQTSLTRIQKEFDLLPLVPSYATDTRPGAIHDSALIARAATDLLKDHGSPYSVRSFNRKAIAAGYLAEKTRPSTVEPSKIKKFYAVTTKGLQFGKNLIHLDEMRGTQPNWYEDSFGTLLTLI